MARGTSFTLLIVVAVAACVGDDPKPAGTTPGADGGTSSSSSGGGPTGTNLAENGGFENGCAAPLFDSNGELSSDPSGKTGKACKVCRTPGGEPSLYFYAPIDVKPKIGETYEVSVLVRKAPGIESGGNSQISIGGVDSSNSFNDDGALANGPTAITDEWKEAKVSWTVAKDGADRARVDLGLPQAVDGICFLVEDLFVTKK